MNKFRYNDANERMKRVNRVYLIAITILFGVFAVYQSLLVQSGELPAALESRSRNLMIIAVVIDAVLFLLNKSGKYLRVLITFEVCIAYLFFILNTEGSFLGMAFVGALGVSVLYYDTKYYTYTLLLSTVVYIAGQIIRVNSGVVSGDVNGICNVIMTFAVFIMFFIISRLSKMFNDHALGAIEEQSGIQKQIMETVKEETESSTECVNSLYDASENIARSMQNISALTKRMVENITNKIYMTQIIRVGIERTRCILPKWLLLQPFQTKKYRQIRICLSP